MTTTTGGPNAAFSQWMGWQQQFWKDWMANAGKGIEQMMSMWQMDNSKLAPWLTDWQEAWKKAAGSVPGASEGHLGQEVFGKVMDASKIYQDLLGFWTRAMAPLAKVPVGTKLSAENMKELHNHWLKEYTSMMESLWGAIPDKDFQETAKAVASAGQVATEQSWEVLEPVFKNLEQVPAILERMMKGERGAAFELTGLFQKNYEATIGKVLRAPSMGMSREITERLNKTLDAYIQFNTAMAQYHSMFLATGQQASEKIFAKLAEFQGKELTPETFKEFYRIWWTINEETYHDLFITEEFVSMLQEVLRRGLLFRKWSDELTGEILEGLNVPTKKDMDEIYQALYELRKEVRWQRRAIHELEQKAGVEVKKPKLSGK